MSPKPWGQLIKGALKQVSVEPFVFLVMLGYNVRLITMQSLFHDRACRVSLSFSDEICDNLDSGHNNAQQTEAVKYGNNLYNALLMVATLPAIVISTFIGPWSDRYSRKFPMILACSGILIDTTLETIITTIPDASPLWYLACASIAGLSGGLMVIMSTAYSYMSDVTDERSRQTRYAVLEFFSLMATPFGSFIGGKVFTFAGYLSVMIIGNCSIGVAMLWLCFYIKETKPRNTDITKKQMLQDVIKLDNLKESYKTCIKTRPGNLRLQLWLLVLVSFTLRLIHMGSIGIGFSYTRTVFKWGVERFSYTTTMFSLLNAFATIVIVPYLNKKLLVHEAAVGLIGVLSLMTKMILLSASVKEWILFYAWFCGCLFACGGIAVRSRVSKLVSRSEMGKVFSLFGICESPTPVLGSLIMIQVFNLSVDVFPGLPYALGALLLVPSAVIFIEEDSENDVNDLNYVLDDSSDGDFYSSDEDQALLVPVGDNKKPEKDDFVLVKFTAKQKILYAGKNNNINALNDYEITFVKFSGNFVFPPVPDVSTVCQEDIKFILPKPITYGKTKWWMMNLPSMTIEQYTESEDAKNMKELKDIEELEKPENVKELKDASANVF